MLAIANEIDRRRKRPPRSRNMRKTNGRIQFESASRRRKNKNYIKNKRRSAISKNLQTEMNEYHLSRWHTPRNRGAGSVCEGDSATLRHAANTIKNWWLRCTIRALRTTNKMLEQLNAVYLRKIGTKQHQITLFKRTLRDGMALKSLKERMRSFLALIGNDYYHGMYLDLDGLNAELLAIYNAIALLDKVPASLTARFVEAQGKMDELLTSAEHDLLLPPPPRVRTVDEIYR